MHGSWWPQGDKTRKGNFNNLEAAEAYCSKFSDCDAVTKGADGYNLRSAETGSGAWKGVNSWERVCDASLTTTKLSAPAMHTAREKKRKKIGAAACNKARCMAACTPRGIADHHRYQV